MKITSVKVWGDGTFDHVIVDIDGAQAGSLLVTHGEGEVLAALLRVKAMASGAEPHWLVKDFNVLYRCALGLLDSLPVKHVGESQMAVRRRQDLQAQLDRLKPAFTDTEEVREWMRQRG